MEVLQNFHFIRPGFLVLLLPVALLSMMYFRRKLQHQHWRNLLDEALIPHMVQQGGGQHRVYLASAFLSAILLSILALAGPTWQQQEKPVFQNDSALVILLDLSLSMLAEDVSPSRIERAKYKIRDLLQLRQEGETALIAYAGDAFVVTPLTDDIETIISQLGALTPEVMPELGYRADLAIQKAEEILKNAGHSQGEILLISDQINPLKDIAVAEQMFAADYRISVMAVGSEEASPIPLPNGQYLKKRNGEIVIPAVDAASLQQLANAGGGVFYSMRLDDSDIAHFNSLLGTGEVSEDKNNQFTSEQWIEAGPWLLLFVVPIAALGFRKGYLYALMIFMVPLPEPVQAFEWSSLWKNSDQRAQELLQQEQYDEAAETFTNEDWKSVAKYRAGDYQASVDLLAEKEDLTSRYNRATALAKAGQLEQALQMYQELLQQNPEHEDAAYNRDVIEQALQQQQQQNQQPSEDSKQGNGEQGQQQESGSDSSEQQGSDSNSERSSSDEQQQQDAGGNQSERQDASSQRDNESAGDQQENAQGQAANEDVLSEEDFKQAMREQMEREQSQPQQEQEGDEGDEQSRQDIMAEIQQSEEQQAVEQMLRRIPDDPAGLLKRKFNYQYQQRARQRVAPPSSEQKW